MTNEQDQIKEFIAQLDKVRQAIITQQKILPIILGTLEKCRTHQRITRKIETALEKALGPGFRVIDRGYGVGHFQSYAWDITDKNMDELGLSIYLSGKTVPALIESLTRYERLTASDIETTRQNAHKIPGLILELQNLQAKVSTLLPGLMWGKQQFPKLREFQRL